MEWRRWPWLIAVYVFLALAVTVIQCAVLAFHNPRITALMRVRAGEAREEGMKFEIKQTWLPYEHIPANVKRAVVAAEDDKFFRHSGFDWEALREAYERIEKTGKVRRGGSTITQQLAKNLFLSPSRSYVRKAREALLTTLMEQFLSKDRILELYLNCIEFGPGIFGIEEAAQYHYKISATQLSLDQSCRLAAIIPSPRRYRVNGNYVQRRAETLRNIIAGPPIETETDRPDMIRPTLIKPETPIPDIEEDVERSDSISAGSE